MPTIIRLSDNEASKLPALRREYALRDTNDDIIAIEKFTIRYNRVPDEVWVWRGTMYIPVREGEK